MVMQVEGRVWKRRISVGWLMICLLLLSWGIVWLGNDLNWWNITFPIVPILLIIFALSLIVNQILSMFY